MTSVDAGRAHPEEVSMRRRNWSIRSRIVALVLPPMFMFVTYWLIGTLASGIASVNLLNAEEARTGVLDPGATVVTELQRERQLTAAAIAGRGDAPAGLREQRTRTDAAVADFRRRATNADGVSDRAATRVSESVTAFDSLGATRATVDTTLPERVAALADYDRLVDAVFRVYQPLMELDDPEATRLLRASVHVAAAREQLARQDAILTLGRFTDAERSQFNRATGARRQLLAEASTELDGAARTGFSELASSTELVALETLENRTTAPTPADWSAVRGPADRRMRAFEADLNGWLAERVDTVSTLWYWRFGLAAVVGLVAIVLTIAITLRVGSSLIRRLRGLRSAALDHALVRLPGVVRRLRHGEPVDLAAEAPELEFGTDEIGEVGRAFSAAQRTAVESAVQEAQVRRGLNEVFLNIARRSQTLLHRQLTLLDRMERRTTDPQELEDLFRIDHMATRMRRHAEDLVILAGAAPGRGWREPVPLVDVVRGAVSEVEDYTRVEVLTIPEASLSGRAVTDLIHLLAELIENATSFSPPHTKVNVVGQLVPNGFAVEVEDRGLGMSEPELADANARLRQPPEFDPTNSARLGLFVVALLAARLGAQVTLRQSPFGGVTAVVLVPPDLVVTEAVAVSVGVEAVAALPAPPPEIVGRASGREPLDQLRGATPLDRPVDGPTGPLAELTEDGLPRRVRRSAPQPAADATGEPVPRRSPEQTRAMMSAFQSASTRGRRDAAAEPEQET
jgi:signal transduction histidine kinase